MNLSKILLQWYSNNKRNLPWRDDPTPYRVWLSEIILQQTRVDQGLDYFNRFILRYPTIESLARAQVDEIMKLWQGLGYYSRARNLHLAAGEIMQKFNGSFPEKYADIIGLRGIGSYTAAAIASIAFNEAVPVIDGNVYRFLGRYFGIALVVDSSEGKRKFRELASSIIDTVNPGMHNQAVMEFGALQCRPRNPLCNECMLKESCFARANNLVHKLPVKKVRSMYKKRYFNYMIIHCNTKTYINKRRQKDIWQMLYEFPLIESPDNLTIEEFVNSDLWNSFFSPVGNFSLIGYSKTYHHKLSHQLIAAKFFRVRIDKPSEYLLHHYHEIDVTTLSEYAVPRLIDKYLEENYEDLMQA